MLNNNPFTLSNRPISDSSDSLDISYQFKPDQVKFFPASPRSPEKILETMIKHFKIHKTLPVSLLSDLPLDTCKIIVEKLLQERLSLQEENLKAEESADEEKEYERPSTGKQVSSTKKLQVLRAFENVSPIEKDDSERYTNYNINSLALTVHEETIFNTINVREKYEEYKKEILQLTSELKEIISCNHALSLIISLDKDNENEELKNQISEKMSLLDKFSLNLSNQLKILKNSIEPSEGFLEYTPLHRRDIKVLTEIIAFDKKNTCKPSEMQIINEVLDCCIDRPESLDKFVDNLLAGHDVAEISLVLVKYIKHLEEQTNISLRTEALNCLITEVRNDFEFEETLAESIALNKELNKLKAQKRNLEFRNKKKLEKKQIKIREGEKKNEKVKWKLPSSLENLSGAELYSKALAITKKK